MNRNREPNPHQAKFEQATRFMQSRLDQLSSIGDIADHVGCSTSWLRKVFRSITGKGVLPYLIELRVQQARQLLRETQLSITEIGMEVGFGHRNRFLEAFRKSAGVPPSAYRRNARAGTQAAQIRPLDKDGIAGGARFEDNFDGPVPGPAWQPGPGKWFLEENSLAVRSEENSEMNFNRVLPENFAVELDFFRVGTSMPGLSILHLAIRDQHARDDYCRVVVGSYDNTVGELRHYGRTVQYNARAVIQANVWRKTRLEVHEHTIRFILDGQTVFEFRDPFPPAVTRKCKFHLGTWQSHMRFRGFRVVDLGLQLQVPVSRQGDTLFHAGLYDQARDLYARYLGHGLPDEETMELRYKTGMCELRLENYARARAWMEKVTDLPHTRFWWEEACLACLEMDHLQAEFEPFVTNADSLLASRTMHERARAIVRDAAQRSRGSGFRDRAAEWLGLISTHQPKTSLPYFTDRLTRGDTLQEGNRLDQACKLLASLSDSDMVPSSTRLRAQYIYINLLGVMGEFGLARQHNARIRSRGRDRRSLADCEIAEAYLLRGEEKFDAALEKLSLVQKDYPDVGTPYLMAGTQKFLLFGMLGRMAEAREQKNLLCRGDAPLPSLSSDQQQGIQRQYLLFCGEYLEAAGLFAEGSRRKSGNPCARANCGVTSGVLFEIAGQSDEASLIWHETMRRFPLSSCNYYASLVTDLIEGDGRCLKEMPEFPRIRAEMFYLAGLLFQKRGNMERARQLWKTAVEEDATLRWASWLAKKKLDDWTNGPMD